MITTLDMIDQFERIDAQDTLLKNATLFDPTSKAPRNVNIRLKNGVIEAIEDISAASSSHTDSAQTLDLQQGWVTPHFIDLGAQLREPGFEHKGSLLRESYAAYAGGFSDIAMLPDTLPVIDTPAVLGLIKERAKNCPVNIAPICAITSGLKGQQLSEIFALKEAGCCALTQSQAPFRDNRLALRCLEYVATTGLTVFFYSEDQELAGDGFVHEGPIADRLGLAGIPECAETTAIARDLLLIERTGVKAHFGHISSARSLELICDAQKEGLPVTADVALTHLAFDENALLGFNPQFHLRPPLRGATDRLALLQGVNNGQLSISIGHQPQDIAAKTAPFAEAEIGMSLYDTHIAIAHKLISAGELDPMAWIRALTLLPAALLGKPIKGLSVGDKASFNVISDYVWTPNKQNCHSLGGNIFGFFEQQKGKLTHRVDQLNH